MGEVFKRGDAKWSCNHGEDTGPLWYFSISGRTDGPYKKQRRVKAIIDVADDGALAGIELIDNMPPAPKIDHKIGEFIGLPDLP